MIYFISEESECVGIKSMELKLWNVNHTKHVSYKRTNSKVKLGTLHFNNMKNVEARYEELENIVMMDNLTVGNLTQNMKDYLLDLKVDDMRLFTAIEQG